MPSKYTKTNLPKPRDKSLFTEGPEPSKAATIKFNGRADEKMLRKKRKFFYTGYNIPTKNKSKSKVYVLLRPRHTRFT